jgi:hypothetical protein
MYLGVINTVKIIIAGSRGFTNYEVLKNVIKETDIGITEIIVGGAKGADALGERYAKEHNIPHRVFPADWEGLGKAAGYIRNVDMLTEADGVIVFWDGVSKGTKHMWKLAVAERRFVLVYRYKRE